MSARRIVLALALAATAGCADAQRLPPDLGKAIIDGNALVDGTIRKHENGEIALCPGEVARIREARTVMLREGGRIASLRGAAMRQSLETWTDAFDVAAETIRAASISSDATVHLGVRACT